LQTNKVPAVVKDVWISIKGTSPNYSEDEGVELITEGKLFISGGRYMVEYDESHMTGMSGTRTSMSIDGDIVTVMRRGNINSNFIFTRGQRQDSLYETDHGDMMMSVFTNKVDIDFNENGGEVKVEYQVDFENDTGRNYINILVKEVRN
jgi:uncharacterized beta-barrel protein YwiB (DUF1934 family)